MVDWVLVKNFDIHLPLCKIFCADHCDPWHWHVLVHLETLVSVIFLGAQSRTILSEAPVGDALHVTLLLEKEKEITEKKRII